MLPHFELLVPQDVPETLRMLAECAPQAKPLAGGTNLIVDLRSRRECPFTLVDIGRLPALAGVTREDGHLRIGATTTIAEVLADPLVAQNGDVLRQAAAVFASPLVRNRATLAGNIVDASPAADSLPPLLVMNAQVELASRDRRRCIPVEDFVVGVRKTVLEPDELVTAVRWPLPQVGVVGGFTKVGLRKADAISVLSAAVLLQRVGDHCVEVRIALGAVAPRPLRARAAEDSLKGQRLTHEVIEHAARLATNATQPIDDIRGSGEYRRKVTEVVVRRLLERLALVS